MNFVFKYKIKILLNETPKEKKKKRALTHKKMFVFQINELWIKIALKYV